MDEINIINPTDEKRVNALRMIMLYRSEGSLIPELFDVFGRDLLFKFIDIFAGTTVKVPDKETLRRIIRDTAIYISLLDNYSDLQVDYLARRYDISQTEVVNIFKELHKVVHGEAKNKKSKKRKAED